VTTKCTPLDFLPLCAFRIENEEQQDEVESNETNIKSVHGGFNAGGARHVPSAAMKSQRRHHVSRRNAEVGLDVREAELAGSAAQLVTSLIAETRWTPTAAPT
jgi:hypothetical protein